MSSSAILAKLRTLMAAQQIDAYIIPSADPHLSEYTSECFQRRGAVSGFTGSAGTAVVTATRALLWTDGRYFVQAERQLSDEWTLMRQVPEVPGMDEWLLSHAEALPRVGVDAGVMSIRQSAALQRALESAGQTLVFTPGNLVDAAWGDARPALPSGPVLVHPVEWSGQATASKLSMVRGALQHNGASACAVAALDEIAWLYNIRGSDVLHCPVVLSYAVVTADAAYLFVDAAKVGEEAAAFLTENGITVRPYNDVFAVLGELSAAGETVMVDAEQCTRALSNAVAADLVLEETSPITLPKAIKNDVELHGVRQAHIEDAVALTKYFSWLEGAVAAGEALTEYGVAQQLLAFRAEQPHFVSPSFTTISSMGANGAVIHYQPPEEGSAPVTADSLYLCDSGGQFRGGTTDVTRTMCFGTPTAYQRRCFTRVLQGHIALDSVVFPAGTTGRTLDVLARAPLWRDGLDYLHGTGHGVGAYLNVHEGPQGISHRRSCDETALEPGMVLSNEPGYYEDGAFGIRIENLVIVTRADTPHQFRGRAHYNFECVTFVPIQTALMDTSVMTSAEIEWVNAYHARCWSVLHDKVDGAALAWLKRETAPIAK